MDQTSKIRMPRLHSPSRYAACGTVLVATANLLTAQIVVGANVHVSISDSSETQTEGLLAADAVRPYLLGCTMVFDARSMRWVVVTYASRDSGAHWTETFRTDPSQQAMDPTCAFG